MKQPHRILVAAAGGALLLGGVLVPGSLLGQSDILPPPDLLAPATPAAPARAAAPARVPVAAQPAADNAAVEALIAEVVAQQAQLAENQKIIDQKLAVIAENLRIARIYVSRAK